MDFGPVIDKDGLAVQTTGRIRNVETGGDILTAAPVVSAIEKTNEKSMSALEEVDAMQDKKSGILSRNQHQTRTMKAVSKMMMIMMMMMMTTTTTTKGQFPKRSAGVLAVAGRMRTRVSPSRSTWTRATATGVNPMTGWRQIIKQGSALLKLMFLLRVSSRRGVASMRCLFRSAFRAPKLEGAFLGGAKSASRENGALPAFEAFARRKLPNKCTPDFFAIREPK